MKRYIAFLLVTFSVIPFALAKTRSKYAVIEVRCDSVVPGTMYLDLFREPLLDFEPIDSAHADVQGRYRFCIIPDPRREYHIMLGQKWVSYGLYLAPGDSLVLSYVPRLGDSLRFDRLGAFREYRNSPKPWYRPRQYYNNLDSMDWNSWQKYLSALRDSLNKRASLFRTRFPSHIGLSRMFLAEAQEVYYYGMMYYLDQDYWDSSGKPVANFPGRFAIMDSIPWDEPPLARSQEIYALVREWTYLSWLRWHHAGIDTAGKNRSAMGFQFVHRLPTLARDVAELNNFDESSYGMSPSELYPIVKTEQSYYRTIAHDTAYSNAFDKKVSGLNSRLPGHSAPSFSLPDSNKVSHSLTEFHGKIIYLDFWGTWCGPCRAEIPDLLKLEKTFEGDTNVAFVSIALQAQSLKEQDLSSWRKYIFEKHLGGTQLYATDQFQNPTAKAFGIWGVPTFMLINRDGTFIDAAAPRPSSGKAEAAIRAALAGKSD